MNELEPSPAPGPAPAAGRRGDRRRRRAGVVSPSARLALGMGVLVALACSRRPEAGRTAPARAPAAAVSASAVVGTLPVAFHPEVESRNFVVAEASGRAETLRGTEWILVKAGDVLTTDDLVRTGVGRVLLKISGTSEVELRERVEIRLDSISRAGASLDLLRGKVMAHVGRRGDNVAITAAHTRTENAGGLPARFVVTADEKGRVAVAAMEGSATVEAAGRSVTVAAGRQTRAEPGSPPLDPEKIPEDLLLAVSWPAGERHEEKLPITGSVAPGSQVRVNGAPAALDGAGHFAASVAMRNGPNPVEVEVEDLIGRSKRERRQIKKVATEAPPLAPVPTELWPP